MNIIKSFNKRDGGYLFHYAHFLCDCLFPEIINGFNNFDVVIREKKEKQTIGNFSKMYEEITNTKTIELNSSDFNKTKYTTLVPPRKEWLLKSTYINYFRNYIFSRYEINPLEYDNSFPKVLLVKRGTSPDLVDKSLLTVENKEHALTSGKERREINDVDTLDLHLKEIFGDKFRSVYFENVSFKEQVKYFNNAKLIICAHGAVMSNMFFCKQSTTIVEVTCDKKWEFFDKLSNIISLRHIKINENNIDYIKRRLNDIIKDIEL